MYLLDLKKRTNASGTFNLHVVGDMHADRVEFDDQRFKAHIKAIAQDKTAVCIVIGDLLDGRIPGRKHFDPDTVRMDFLANLRGYVNHGLDVLEDYLSPLVKAGVPTIFVVGNHDEYLEEIGLTAELVKRLGRSAYYLGGEGFVRLRTGDKEPNYYTTVLYARHGSGGGKKPGSKVNAMQAEFEWIDADAVIEGHVHDSDVRVIEAHSVPRSGTLELQLKKRVMFRAPGYVRRAVAGRVGYQGKKGYPASDTGLFQVTFNPKWGTTNRLELPI